MGYSTHMKTTIEISDNLLRRAKRLAAKEQVTLRSLAEEGLAHVLKMRERRRPVPVKPLTVKGKGLSPEFQGRSWEHLRSTVYEGRGE